MNRMYKKILLSRSQNIFKCLSARSAHWNKDWMPGPYPKTPEERAAAAKKYGLLPEEYEPYPDDGLVGRGDYPKLKDISVENKDPHYPWDYPEYRKNYGEPMHAFSDLYGEDRLDINASEKARYSKTTMFLTFAGVMTFFYSMLYLCEGRLTVSRPVMARHYPSDGVHYKY